MKKKKKDFVESRALEIKNWFWPHFPQPMSYVHNGIFCTFLSRVKGSIAYWDPHAKLRAEI